MSVGFHDFKSIDRCGICFESMNGSNTVVAHEGVDGEKHPWHRDCIKDWMNVRPECPACNVPLEMKSLFSWKERSIVLLKNVTWMLDSEAELSDPQLLTTLGVVMICLYTLVQCSINSLK